ncbi:MAG: hypothetical protein WCF20_12775 [Methylovirgula sp.]
MRSKLLLCAMAYSLGAAAAPSMAAAASAVAPAPQPASGGSYVNADGSYPSYQAFIRELDGVPCGIECTRSIEERSGYFGLAPHQLKRQ